jgi:NADH-quinone oxidoreductase subunit N
LPEILLFYSFILLFIYNFFFTLNFKDCVVIYFNTLVVVIYIYKIIINNNNFIINNNLFYNSQAVISIKIFVLVLTLIVMSFMYFLGNRLGEIEINVELFFLILLCLFGIIIFLMGNDLFIIYLGIELQSLALYILCSLKKYSNTSLESGLKYFLYGSYSSAVLLLGISLIYGLLGSLNLNDLFILTSTIDLMSQENLLLQFSFLCVTVGFLFKLALFPFH